MLKLMNFVFKMMNFVVQMVISMQISKETVYLLRQGGRQNTSDGLQNAAGEDAD